MRSESVPGLPCGASWVGITAPGTAGAELVPLPVYLLRHEVFDAFTPVLSGGAPQASALVFSDGSRNSKAFLCRDSLG